MVGRDNHDLLRPSLRSGLNTPRFHALITTVFRAPELNDLNDLEDLPANPPRAKETFHNENIILSANADDCSKMHTDERSYSNPNPWRNDRPTWYWLTTFAHRKPERPVTSIGDTKETENNGPTPERSRAFSWTYF